jgi:hypothetical protein
MNVYLSSLVLIVAKNKVLSLSSLQMPHFIQNFKHTCHPLLYAQQQLLLYVNHCDRVNCYFVHDYSRLQHYALIKEEFFFKV